MSLRVTRSRAKATTEPAEEPKTCAQAPLVSLSLICRRKMQKVPARQFDPAMHSHLTAVNLDALDHITQFLDRRSLSRLSITCQHMASFIQPMLQVRRGWEALLGLFSSLGIFWCSD